MTRKEQGREIAKRYESLEDSAGRPNIDISKLPKEAQEEAKQILAELDSLVSANPLSIFKPHSASADGRRFQLDFLAATTKTVAAFCGNQAGKTSIGVVKSLIQVLPREFVPDHLQPFKQFEAPCHGWVLCPTEDKIFDSLKPAFEKWCPKAALKGGRWDKAFNGERMQLTFACGSTIAFKTYKQDPATLGGATLHWVLYDEPPPRAHRDESATRLLAHNGPEWFTMTPLKVNTAWIRRDIWRNREDPEITCVKGSMRDNPVLSREAIDRILASYRDDIWRQAREFGDFMDASGAVYAGFEDRLIDPPTKQFVKGLDNIVGIDPGIRNAAFVFGGFDHHGVDWVWDELLIQNGTPTQYAEGIDNVLAKWGLRREDVMFVIDPAARQRSQATGDTVQSELSKVGIYTMNGNRDKEAGQQQIRDRLKHERLRISRECLGLRDEADELAWEMDDDGLVTGAADDSAFHRLATLRYQVMSRPWYPQMEARAAERTLGWRPGQALPGHELVGAGEYAPMGPLS